MKYFIGLDVSLASAAICVLSGHGKIVKEVSVMSEPEALVTFLRSLPGAIVAVGWRQGRCHSGCTRT